MLRLTGAFQSVSLTLVKLLEAAFTIHTVFCDEAGNTGSNLLDPSQPVYVLSALLTPPPGPSVLDEIVAQIKTDYRIQGELKGSRILTSPRGWNLARDLVDAFAGASGVVSFIVAEKRYCVAAKAVETYLDADYNKRVSWDEMWDPERKQELADAIYGADDAALEAFGLAYKDRDAAGLLQALDLLTAEMRRLHHDELAKKLAGARRITAEIARREASVDSKGAAWASLNFPVFTGMLHKLEELGRIIRARNVRVVHDETKEFEPVFRWWFERMRQAAPGNITVADRTMLFPFKSLKDFCTTTSDSSPGVQAADVVARAICLSAQAFVKGTALPSESLEVQRRLLPLVLTDKPQFAYPIASSKFNRGVLVPAVRALLSKPL